MRAIIAVGLSIASTVAPLAVQAKSAKAKNATKTKSAVKTIDWKKHFDAGNAAFAKRDFSAAKNEFSVAAAAAPREAGVQYYLGASAAYASDYKTAQEALSRCIVETSDSDLYSKNAHAFLKGSEKQIGILSPYSVLAPDGKLIRWADSMMPIKIYVTQGLQLPPNFSGDALTMDNFVQLQPYLHEASFYKRLGLCPAYEPVMYASAIAGLNQWNWASTEKFLSYKLVASPSQADIVVFWCPTMTNLAGKTYYNSAKGAKTVVQICTKINDIFPKWVKPTLISNTAAHEFGHAWGLASHSPNIKDLMSASHETIIIHYNGVGHIAAGVTANDCASLRALYQLPADYYLER